MSPLALPPKSSTAEQQLFMALHKDTAAKSDPSWGLYWIWKGWAGCDTAAPASCSSNVAVTTNGPSNTTEINSILLLVCSSSAQASKSATHVVFILSTIIVNQGDFVILRLYLSIKKGKDSAGLKEFDSWTLILKSQPCCLDPEVLTLLSALPLLPWLLEFLSFNNVWDAFTEAQAFTYNNLKQHTPTYS